MVMPEAEVMLVMVMILAGAGKPVVFVFSREGFGYCGRKVLFEKKMFTSNIHTNILYSM